MANLEAWSRVSPNLPPASETDVEGLFRARYLEMVRLAGLLGADDPEDIAQEAFLRLMNARPQLDDPQAALPYSRAIVCNLTRNRHRHRAGRRRPLRPPLGPPDDAGRLRPAALVIREGRR